MLLDIQFLDKQEFMNKFRKTELSDFSYDCCCKVLYWSQKNFDSEGYLLSIFSDLFEIKPETFEHFCSRFGSMNFWNIALEELKNSVSKLGAKFEITDSLEIYSVYSIDYTSSAGQTIVYSKTISSRKRNILQGFKDFIDLHAPDLYFNILLSYYNQMEDYYEIIYSGSSDESLIILEL